MSESSGWIQLTSGVNMWTGAFWSTGPPPWTVNIPESELSALLVVTGLASPISIPAGSTEILATFRITGGHQTGSNRDAFDPTVYSVVGESIGDPITDELLPTGEGWVWEIPASDLVLTPEDIDGDFGVGIQLGMYANHPSVDSDVWITSAEVNVTWIPPAPFSAREEVQYA